MIMKKKKRLVDVAVAVFCIAAVIFLFVAHSGLQIQKQEEAAFPLPVDNDGMLLTPYIEVESSEEDCASDEENIDDELKDNMKTPSNRDSVGYVATLYIKGKPYNVSRGVDKQTLNKGIGWLETSSLPPNDGICVLMGHRDKQFKALKDIIIGEEIKLVLPDGISYTYTVRDVYIYDDDNYVFPAYDGTSLILTTCFPFSYRGRAPKKYVVTAL